MSKYLKCGGLTVAILLLGRLVVDAYGYPWGSPGAGDVMMVAASCAVVAAAVLASALDK